MHPLFKMLDLTHELSPDVPSWNGSCGFSHTIKMDYEDASGDVKFRVQQIKMHAGIGTHMDAPAHCDPRGKCISEIDLESLLAPCIVIDVSDRADANYSLGIKDIDNFEKKEGKLPENAFVIVRTGWERFWHEPDKYRNDYFFPGVSKEAAELLLERALVGLGIDTLSPDRPSDGFPVHQLILGSGKYIVENVANSGKLPPKGAYSLALPIKTKEGTEAPIRLIGLVF